MHDTLRHRLTAMGATVVGFADVGEALSQEISHLKRAVSIGVYRALREDTLSLLGALQKEAKSYLKANGYRYLSIPPDSDRVVDTFVSKLYPLFTHKIAATSAGLGWIGRNGLLISPEYGPRLSLATVLTDAPLSTDEPTHNSMCQECDLCQVHCPSGAITGQQWSRTDPFPKLLKVEQCSEYKLGVRKAGSKPTCGLCITICPYGRTNGKGAGLKRLHTVEDK